MDKRQYAGFLIKQISEKTDKKIIRTFKKYGVTCSQHRYLTDEGSALLKSSRRDAIDVGKEFWKDFSDEEIETLIAILEKLKGNLNND